MNKQKQETAARELADSLNMNPKYILERGNAKKIDLWEILMDFDKQRGDATDIGRFYGTYVGYIFNLLS